MRDLELEENIEIFEDVPNETNTYYFMATILDEEYEPRTPALMSLDEVLSHAGDCDNDSIMSIQDVLVEVLYKWSTERQAWQLVH